jgi:hypothetical protein
MGTTAPASWVRYQAVLVVGGWLCYTALCLWFRVHGNNSDGFIRFNRRSNSLLLNSWIASTYYDLTDNRILRLKKATKQSNVPTEHRALSMKTYARFTVPGDISLP